MFWVISFAIKNHFILELRYWIDSWKHDGKKHPLVQEGQIWCLSVLPAICQSSVMTGMLIEVMETLWFIFLKNHLSVPHWVGIYVLKRFFLSLLPPFQADFLLWESALELNDVPFNFPEGKSHISLLFSLCVWLYFVGGGGWLNHIMFRKMNQKYYCKVW